MNDQIKSRKYGDNVHLGSSKGTSLSTKQEAFTKKDPV